jgi:hypothetical protein
MVKVGRKLPKIEHGGIAQLGARIAHLPTPKRAPNLDPILQLNNGSPKIPFLEISGGIAQLGERLNGIQEVSGSIPLISTIGNRKRLVLMNNQNELFCSQHLD